MTAEIDLLHHVLTGEYIKTEGEDPGHCVINDRGNNIDFGCPRGAEERLFMTKAFIGLVMAFLIGAGCRWFDIPVPSPPRLLGAFLVLAITGGYLLTDRLLERPDTRPGNLVDSAKTRTVP